MARHIARGAAEDHAPGQIGRLAPQLAVDKVGAAPQAQGQRSTDNGKVGGPDGTWGTGAQKTWTRKQQTTVTPRTEENTQQTTPDQTEESQNSGQGSGDGGNAGNTPSPGGSDTNGGNTGSETGNDGSGGSPDGDTQQP